MKPEDAKKLLGGYATGTLSVEERKALFEAALADQELFNALADEEALRELLADPAYRRELVAGLREKPLSLTERFVAWWQRPAALAWAGAAAAIVLGGVIVYQSTRPPTTTEVAMVSSQPSTSPAPTPALSDEASPESQGLQRAGNETPEPSEEAARRDEPLPAVSPPAADASAPQPPPEAPKQAAQAVRSRTFEGAAASAPVALGQGQAEPFATSERREAVQPTAASGSLGVMRTAASALPYTLERLASDGAWAAIPNSTVLGLSDRVRLAIQAPQTGTLSLMDAASNESLWTGPVTAGSRYTVPPGGLTPPDQAGARRLLLRYGTVDLASPIILEYR